MTNAEPLPAAFRLSALSAAVAEFLRSADQMAHASGNLYAAAYHLREAGDTAAADKLTASRTLLEQAVNGSAVPALRHGAELAELLEQDAATAGEAERLRWKLADVWENSDTAEPHPVPVSGVYAVPEGVLFLPHGDTFPAYPDARETGEAATFTAERSAEGERYTVRVSLSPSGEALGVYTMPAHVLTQLEQAADLKAAPYQGHSPESATEAAAELLGFKPWRLPPPLILSAEKTEGGGVLLTFAGGEAPVTVPEGAGYALAYPLGGLFTLSVYAAELTGDPERPAEVVPLLSSAFLTHDAEAELEALGIYPSRDRTAAHIAARRKAWDTLPAPKPRGLVTTSDALMLAEDFKPEGDAAEPLPSRDPDTLN